jgi:hypothetical protein
VLCVTNSVFSSKKVLVFSDLSRNYARKLPFDLECIRSVGRERGGRQNSSPSFCC